jgi:hypothetical protein
MVLGPSRWSQGGNGALFEVGQARQHILQVLVGGDPQPMAGSDDRIDYRATPTRVGMADEQEVLLADGRGPDGILNPVMPPPTLCRVTELEARITVIVSFSRYQRAA